MKNKRYKIEKVAYSWVLVARLTDTSQTDKFKINEE